jgi:serine/threonine protein kinase/Tfp pilus assembly protein PilF
MADEKWQKVREIFDSALSRQPEERQKFVNEACGEDKILLAEVESLLSSHDSAESFMETPAVAEVAHMIEIEIKKLEAGKRFGHYEIIKQIGAGGMGEVYLAKDTRLERKTAIKILRGNVAEDEERMQRFVREAKSASALNHPNIITIYEIGETDNTHFIATEYIEGDTLRKRLKGSPINLKSALEIAIQVASALDAAHRTGIVHRDIKPENVMIRPDGLVKILDFGIAKLSGPPAVAGGLSVNDSEAATAIKASTSPGMIIGTVAYMPPEQARGLAVDARTDVWSLGVVLYEMIAGQSPFAGPTTSDVIAAILRSEPAPPALSSPDMPAELDRIISKALRKDPDERYQTAQDLLIDLRQLRRELEAEAEIKRIKSSKRDAAAGPEILTAKTKRSIAVLPFANMSADKENEFFSDGLSDEIINTLAHIPGIKVAGRTSSFFFRGKDVEFGEIGRRLKVEHILEGSVRKAGNRVRVMAQLIKVADGFHLWSERYDRELTDIFAIQDEITQAIATALRIRLSPEAAPLRRHEPNLRAYEAYLKARHDCFKATPESLARVKESLDYAVTLDPEFALAYSLLGLHYSMLATFDIRPTREVIPLARAAEKEALRIEPSLPEAHALLGCWAGSYDYDWHEAERQWRLAMEHEPVSHDIRVWYGNHYLLPIGRPLEAVEEMARGLKEDPLNPLYRHHLARGLRYADRLEDAEAELRKVLEVDENYPLALGTLGAICAQQGRFAEALTFTEKAHALTPQANPIIGQLAALLVRAGDKSRAEALIGNLGDGKAYGAPTGLALFHALCGEFDQAAEWTEHAIEERYPSVVQILGPLLRSNPRWPALAKLMNLPSW